MLLQRMLQKRFCWTVGRARKLLSSRPGSYNVPAMNRLRWLAVVAGLLACPIAGCNQVGGIYRSTTGGYLGADITPKKSWQAKGDLHNPGAAIDDDLTTAARSDYQYLGATITVDLRRPCLFQTVILDHGAGEHGHAGKVTVATSMDGKSFLDRHVSPGKRRVTVLCLPKPVLARYVRLRVAAPGAEPWNIAEIYLQ